MNAIDFEKRGWELTNSLISTNQISLLDALIVSSHLLTIVGIMAGDSNTRRFAVGVIEAILELSNSEVAELNSFKLPPYNGLSSRGNSNNQGAEVLRRTSEHEGKDSSNQDTERESDSTLNS